MHKLAYLFGWILLAQGAFAQNLLWYPVMSGGGYGSPTATGEEACFVSHQSFSANAGILPNKFVYGYKWTGDLASTTCSWDRGGPGYWGTSGTAYLFCPSGMVKSGDDNDCAPLEENSCPSAGNPVSIVGGAKNELVTDFVVGRGRLKFERSYSSFRTDPTRLGKGWSSNFHAQFDGANGSSGSRFNYRLPGGAMLRFLKDGSVWQQAGITTSGWRVSSSYERLDQPGYTLDEVSSSELVLKGPDGVERQFVLSSSYTPNIRMTQIRYRDGYEIDLTYGASGALQTATDTDGYEIAFDYDSKNRLNSVTAPDGSVYLYEYEEFPGSVSLSAATNNALGWLHFSRLSKVIYPDDTPANDADNPFVQYHYEDSDFPVALTGKTDERGIRVRTWAYDFVGSRLRAVSSTGPLGRELTTISENTGRTEYTVENALGKETVYTAATIGRTRKVTEVDGLASANCVASNSTISYNSYGQMTGKSGAESETQSLTLDTSYNLPTQIVEGAGTPYAETAQISWDTGLRKPTTINRDNLTTQISYNANGQPLSATLTDTTSHSIPYSTNGQQRTWTFTWSGGGQIQSIDGPLSGTSDVVSYTYDSSGNVATITNELGRVTTINSVDGMGRPTQVTEASGRVTLLSYTLRGWIETVTINPGASQRLTAFTYDTAGNIVRIDQPGSRWVEFDYDDSGWIEEERSSAGEKITYQYDLLGNVTRTDFRTGGGTSEAYYISGYDELGRLTSLLGGAGDAVGFSYDRSNRQTRETDGLGRNWLTAFDALDRIVSVTDPESDSIQMEWAPQGGIKGFEDGRMLTTTFVRNGFGEVIREVSPDRGTTDYWYDAAGRLIRRLDGAGHDVRFTYDDAGRVLSQAYPNQSALNFSYDYDDTTGGNFGVGRLTGITGSVTSSNYTYDKFGQLTSKSDRIGSRVYSLEFEYSQEGDLEQLVLPSGREVEYSSDSAGRIISVSTRSGSGGSLVPLVSSATYAPYGPVTGYLLGNGAAVTFGLDSSYRLTDVSLSDGVYSLLDKNYTYDANSRVTSIADTIDSAASATYTYHDDGRLKRATGPWGDVEWSYDPVGNRVTDKRYISGSLASTETYSYGAADNRLMSISDDTPSVVRTFTYSANGSVSQDIQASTKTYAFGEHGRLSTVTIAGTPTTSYDYNAVGQRVRRIDQSSAATHFIFDPTGLLLGEYNGSTGAVIAEYVWFGRHLVATMDGAGTISYVQSGHLGQPLMVMDGAAQVAWQGEMSPFGTYIHSTGLIFSPELRFPGQWLESTSSLYQNWQRDYDPTIGRYIEVDPVGLMAGQSTYGYADQDPLNKFDAMGLSAVSLGNPGAFRGFRPKGGVLVGVALIKGYVDGINEFQDWVSKDFGLVIDGAENVCRPTRSRPDSQVLPLILTIDGIFDDISLDDPNRCRKIQRACISRCRDIFADTPELLPGSGKEFQPRLDRCIKECVENNGCGDYFGD